MHKLRSCGVVYFEFPSSVQQARGGGEFRVTYSIKVQDYNLKDMCSLSSAGFWLGMNPSQTLSLQFTSVSSDHRVLNKGGPTQWVRVNIIPRLLWIRPFPEKSSRVWHII